MPLQKVEFEFPDPDKVEDKTSFEEKDDGTFVLKVEGRASEEEAKPAAPQSATTKAAVKTPSSTKDIANEFENLFNS